MTRDQAVIVVALAHGLKAPARAVLLAVLADSALHPDGHALVASVEAVARRAGVARSSTWAHLAALEAEGAVSRAGGGVVILESWLMQCSERDRPSPGRSVRLPDDPSVSRTVAPEPSTVRLPDDPSVSRTIRPSPGRSEPSRTYAGDSLSDQIYTQEVVVERGGFRGRPHASAHEAAPGPQVDDPPPAAATPPPMAGHPLLDDEADAEPGEGPPPVVLAAGAWEKALGVTTLPVAHADRLMSALKAHGLDVVVAAAGRIAAYLTEKPMSRTYVLRTPRVVADRVADEVADRAARTHRPSGAKARPGAYHKPISTDPDQWAAAVAANPDLPDLTPEQIRQLEEMRF